MRVQGASDLMATALVMSFFTLILMTGSKVDASTTPDTTTTNTATVPASVSPTTKKTISISALVSTTTNNTTPSTPGQPTATNSPTVSTIRSNNTTTGSESTADLPKSSYNLCVFMALSILFYLWR